MPSRSRSRTDEIRPGSARMIMPRSDPSTDARHRALSVASWPAQTVCSKPHITFAACSAFRCTLPRLLELFGSARTHPTQGRKDHETRQGCQPQEKRVTRCKSSAVTQAASIAFHRALAGDCPLHDLNVAPAVGGQESALFISRSSRNINQSSVQILLRGRCPLPWETLRGPAHTTHRHEIPQLLTSCASHAL